MKKLLILFVLAAFVFSCKTEQKVATEDASTEELRESIMEENTTDLASYEYVCNHCKIGSHEAGKCPCGMDYEKNSNFVKKQEEDGDDEKKNL